MKLYIANGQYVGTQAEAKAITKSYTQVDVPTDKEGLIAYLNAQTEYAEAPEPDLVSDTAALWEDGRDPMGAKVLQASIDSKPSYTEQSVDIDDRFEKLPLAHQLSLAALALERARYQLPVETPRSPESQRVLDQLGEVMNQPNPIVSDLLD